MDDDPGGLRHRVGTEPAALRVARSPVRLERAVRRLLTRLSAPLFRWRSRVPDRGRRLLHYQPFHVSRNAPVLRFRPRFQQRLELCRDP